MINQKDCNFEMQSHKFTVIKLYIPEACSSKFCKAKITIHKLTLCKRNRKQIHFGKITVIKAAKFIITFWQRSFFKVNLFRRFYRVRKQTLAGNFKKPQVSEITKEKCNLYRLHFRSKHLIFGSTK